MIWIWSIVLLGALVGVGALAVAVTRQQRRDAEAAGRKMDDVMLSVLQGKQGKNGRSDI